MNSKVIIRAALEADRDEWVRMRLALWPDCTQERHALEIEQLTHDPDRGVVLIAVRENKSLCGFAEVSIRHDHVDGTTSVPVAYLEGWYVDPDVRQCGIGRKILEAVEDWADERGLTELASDAELDNQKGIVAHLSCGFAETCRAVHFIRRIRSDKRALWFRSEEKVLLNRGVVEPSASWDSDFGLCNRRIRISLLLVAKGAAKMWKDRGGIA